MKKLFLLTALSLLTFTQANASCDTQNQCAPACAPSCCSWGEFSVGAEWLYWKGEQTGLSYGAEVEVDGGGTVIHSQVLRPEFNYRSGYRINANYVTPENNWIFRGSFTHAPVNARSSVEDLGTSSFNFAVLFNTTFPIFNAIQGATFTDLSADWSADYNILDLTAARTFNVCNRLAVTPFIGLKGIWICQDFHLDGLGDAGGDEITFNSNLHSTIGAGGIQGGVISSLDLTHGFSIVGMFGGSVVYGRAKDSGSLEAALDGTGIDVSYDDKPTKSMPSIDAFIGLQYTSCLYGFGFDLFAGWEEHLIYDTNDFSFIGEGTHTTLQGWTLGANVRF